MDRWWNDTAQEKPKVLGYKRTLLCLPKLSSILAWNQARSSRVSGWKINACFME